MDNLENKIIDGNGNEIILTEDDFRFIQQDKKIKDKNFDTKPTTFFKDALSRFRKSRSSVVAAFIIGILMLLSLIVPAASPYNDYTPNINISKMTPRLLSNGTFWSGYRTYTNQPYDLLNDSYGSFDANYITNATFEYTKNNGSSSSYLGGIYLIKSNSSSNNTTMTINETLSIPANSNLIMKLEVTDNETLLQTSEMVFGSYSIDLVDVSDESNVINLLGTTKQTGEVSVNIGEKVPSGMSNVKIRITLYSSGSTQMSCLPIQQMSFTTSDTTLGDTLANYTITKDEWALNDSVFNADDSLTEEEAKTYLDSLKQNSAVIQVNKRNSSDKSLYTFSRGTSGIYGAIAANCSFKYDEYTSKLGLQSFKISQAQMEQYIKNGWCTFTDTTNAESFKMLSDNCPIKSVTEVKQIGNSYEVTGDVMMYQYYGYSSMPRFIFGTDQQGRDLFTYAFFALRTSLIIAFVITAINFIVGIVYGSIEGYFGGNVDLFMERISDILGYLPTTILITLLFLNYGKSLFVFGLGMTLTGWLGVASRTRTQFYRFKGREYVLASRTLGASDARLIFKHVLPNSLGTIITTSILMVPGTISTEATLSYIGLGLEGTASFGVVMSDNQQELLTNPHLVLFPAVIMSLLMISFNLFGNGLRDAFNPSLKGSE